MKKSILLFVALFTIVLFACKEQESYKVGEKVKVMWKGQLYDATIVSKEKDNTYTIHYEGWDDTWNETVGVDRIEPME